MERMPGGHEPQSVDDVREAATVILLRDTDAGPEVLLLERRRDRGSFAGNWVFPGGGIDPIDHEDPGHEHPGDAIEHGAEPLEKALLDEVAVAKRAGVREVYEESGLLLRAEQLVTLSRWTPPEGIPKRIRTWFFVAEAPAGGIRLALEEVIGHRWLRPQDALAEHAAGQLSLVPPTWVTLHGLAQHDSIETALTVARAAPPRQFVTRLAQTSRGQVVLWPGDAGHDDLAMVDAAGGRHRLEIAALPWVYSDLPIPE